MKVVGLYIALLLAVLAVTLPVAFLMAKTTYNQAVDECYSYGRVTQQTVKYAGDAYTGGLDTGCFVKRGDHWSRV